MVFEKEKKRVYNLRVWAKQPAVCEYVHAPPTHCLHATAQRRSGLQLLVYAALSYKCIRPLATSACGHKLHVCEAFRY